MPSLLVYCEILCFGSGYFRNTPRKDVARCLRDGDVRVQRALRSEMIII